MLQVAQNQYVQKGANSLKDLFFYVFEGHIIVDLGRWIVLYCGRVSETAMLLATLWVTATYVTPELTGKLGDTALGLSSLSMIAFSLLPEVILFSAIIKTLKHWQAVIQHRKSVSSWSWAILYTLPTVTFFGMTVFTISLFVSTSGHIQVATGNALVFRCLAGWFYSLVGLIHAGMTTRKSEQVGIAQHGSTSAIIPATEEMKMEVKAEIIPASEQVFFSSEYAPYVEMFSFSEYANLPATEEMKMEVPTEITPFAAENNVEVKTEIADPVEVQEDGSECGNAVERNTDALMETVRKSHRPRGTVTVRQAAEMVGKSERHVRNLINQNTLVKQGNGLVSLKSVNAFVARQKETVKAS